MRAAGGGKPETGCSGPDMERNGIFVFWACWAASYYCLNAEAEAEASFGLEGLWGHWGQGGRGEISPLSGAS